MNAYALNESVFAYWPQAKDFYPGHITKVLRARDNTFLYDVHFDDGDVRKRIPFEELGVMGFCHGCLKTGIVRKGDNRCLKLHIRAKKIYSGAYQCRWCRTDYSTIPELDAHQASPECKGKPKKKNWSSDHEEKKEVESVSISPQSHSTQSPGRDMEVESDHNRSSQPAVAGSKPISSSARRSVSQPLQGLSALIAQEPSLVDQSEGQVQSQRPVMATVKTEEVQEPPTKRARIDLSKSPTSSSQMNPSPQINPRPTPSAPPIQNALPHPNPGARSATNNDPPIINPARGDQESEAEVELKRLIVAAAKSGIVGPVFEALKAKGVTTLSMVLFLNDSIWAELGVSELQKKTLTAFAQRDFDRI